MKLTKGKRKRIWIRDNKKCVHCGKSISILDLSVDHIQPKSLGGTYALSNLAASCRPCNRRRSANLPPINLAFMSAFRQIVHGGLEKWWDSISTIAKDPTRKKSEWKRAVREYRRIYDILTTEGRCCAEKNLDSARF